MARLFLDRVWISDVEDLTNRIVSGSRDREEVREPDIRVTHYANNRTRAVSSPKVIHRITLTLVMLEYKQVLWLRRHQGRILMYRDSYKTAMFCVYTAANFKPFRAGNHWNVSLVLEEITYRVDA